MDIDIDVDHCTELERDWRRLYRIDEKMIIIIIIQNLAEFENPWKGLCRVSLEIAIKSIKKMK